jgi:hypothetical protein
LTTVEEELASDIDILIYSMPSRTKVMAEAGNLNAKQFRADRVGQ